MKLHILIIRIIIPAVILYALSLSGCVDVPRDNEADKGGDNYNDIYSDKRITAFSFVDPAVSGVIDEANSTIKVYVLYGTDVTNRAALFTTNAESVSISGREQRNGITVNDFSRPLYYRVIALDGTSREYTISTEFVIITSFSVTDPVSSVTVNGTIDYIQKTIAVNIPFFANSSALVATFNAVGNVLVSSVLQESGITQNNFTDALVYEVSCQNGTIQNYMVTVNYKDTAVSHLAGSVGGFGSSDGVGSTASFRNPYGITSDPNNMNVLYVADWGNNTIRKIEINTGTVTTIAGSAGKTGSIDGIGSAARFNKPKGITTDGNNLYVVDQGNYTIRKIVISTGVVSTFAGYPGSSASVNGIGTNARFRSPVDVTTDNNNLYVTDQNDYTIRKIVISTRDVSTLAGLSGTSGTADGTSLGRFSDLRGIVTDGTSLYVSDGTRIRKVIIATGEIISLAGDASSGGFADGTGSAARFYWPYGITSDGNNLYVTDVKYHTIRQIVIATAVVTTIAGTTTLTPGYLDGFGTAASFGTPYSITINSTNTNLFVTEYSNNSIRTISLGTKRVSTLAGSVLTTGSADNTGTEAQFNLPSGITISGENMYVSDLNNKKIRKIVISTGVVSTFAGTGTQSVVDDTDGNISTITSNIHSPRGITSDAANIYFCDQSCIRKIVIATGDVITIAGSVSGSADDADGYPNPNAIPPISEATFKNPFGITTDGINLYVADTGNHTIRKIVISTGVVTTIAGIAGTHGSSDGVAISATFYAPRDITTDGTYLYVTDQVNHTIRKIVISTGTVTTIAGLAGSTGSADDLNGYPSGGTDSEARFYYPSNINSDGVNLYLSDGSNHTIRKIVISTGIVTTIAGNPGIMGNEDGAGSAALFTSPNGIAYYNNKLYVSDGGNNAIRVINP